MISVIQESTKQALEYNLHRWIEGGGEEVDMSCRDLCTESFVWVIIWYIMVDNLI